LMSLRPQKSSIGAAAHGQEIFWGKSSFSIREGEVTELTEPYRCKDPWYNEFLEQCRFAVLTRDNYDFLHGNPTKVPGSWLDGRAQCGNSSCFANNLLNPCGAKVKVKDPSKRRKVKGPQECKKCQLERCRRKRVVHEDFDEIHTDRFEKAPAIVPNNDIKYDTNKKRAIRFAHSKQETIFWSVAKDTVSLDTLRDDPSLPLKKQDWLQRHDRDCGDLYGLLPLVRGLPVTLTDHVDRSPDKNLLKGTKGKIHSWKLEEEDEADMYKPDTILKKMPIVVFVKFEGAKWILKGMKEAGVYPIRPVKQDWYLDKNRPVPRLKIKRRQVPLAPGFAMTAHASQGQTLETAIVDLRISVESSRQTSYVALSRVRKAEDILIFRPFNYELFTQQEAKRSA
jgi:hypothetical protein